MKNILEMTVLSPSILFALSLLFLPGVSTADTTTIKVYADPSDGFVELSDLDSFTSWSDARNFMGSPSKDPTFTDHIVHRTDKQSGYYRIYRSSVPFDTSVIPDDATIVSVSIYVYKGIQNNTGTQIRPVSHTRASSSILSSSDWQLSNYGVLPFAEAQSLLDSQYTKFELNQLGVSHVDVGGVSIYGFVTSFDFEDIDPGSTPESASFYSADANGIDMDPYLEITYKLETEKSFEEIFAELLDLIDGDGVSKNILNSYDANLKKVLGFYEEGNYSGVRLQLNAFNHKIEQDLKQGIISDGFASAVGEKLIELFEVLAEENEKPFPLMTQVISPHPSLSETTSWADATYADGRSDNLGQCGKTIRECGCVITSFSMLGNYFGVTEGIDGSEVNPLNMDTWLLENEGYTPNGSIIWGKALEYLSYMDGGKRLALIKQDAHYEIDQNKVNHALQKGSLAMVNSEVGGRHFFLLKEGTDDDLSVKDPYWFNTSSLNEVQNLSENVQNYNDTYTSAHLYSKVDKPVQLGQYIELHLASPAELLITDSKGRRMGYDPETGMHYDEIPNAQYEYEPSIYSSSTPPDTPLHIDKVAYIHLPETNFYTVSVIGTDDGSYTLTSYTRSENGQSDVGHIVGTTTANKIDTYFLSLEKGGSYDVLKELYALQLQVPENDRHKYLSALRVILDKVEKENITAKESIVESLIRYFEDHYGGEMWVSDIVELLEAL